MVPPGPRRRPRAARAALLRRGDRLPAGGLRPPPPLHAAPADRRPRRLAEAAPLAGRGGFAGAVRGHAGRPAEPRGRRRLLRPRRDRRAAPRGGDRLPPLPRPPRALARRLRPRRGRRAESRQGARRPLQRAGPEARLELQRDRRRRAPRGLPGPRWLARPRRPGARLQQESHRRHGCRLARASGGLLAGALGLAGVPLRQPRRRGRRPRTREVCACLEGTHPLGRRPQPELGWRGWRAGFGPRHRNAPGFEGAGAAP
mmetsp:Transcript_129033/g.334567  ORF Transcript_129033/g.334567 Transcript_129033/m.334567 type:complete len:258 (+) Transcript_129033:64-837(+)